MTIKVYTAFTKKQNSTKQPLASEGTEITCTLKEPTSIVNPVFVLESTLKYNYIQWSNRYYFVNDIIYINRTQCEYHCTVDPMASWKTSIGNLTEFVARSQSSYNPSLIDAIYPVTCGVSTHYTAIPKFNYTSSTGMFVLGVVNGATQGSGSIAYYVLNASQLSSLRDLLFSAFWLDGTQTDITLNTQKELINPFQYIVSCNWFPMTTSAGSSHAVRFGWWSTSDSGSPVYGNLLSNSDRNWSDITTITLPSHPQSSTRGNYLNSAPFTQHVLYMLGFGRIPIDPGYFITLHDMVVYVKVDFFTGVGRLVISNGSGDKIMEMSTQVGVPIQLSQFTENYADPVISALDFVGNILTLDFAGAASSVETAAKAAMPTMMITGSTGSTIDYTTAPCVISEFRTQTPMDVSHFGRPLCSTAQISTLSGYIKTENAEVEIPATQIEREMISGIMDGGFYYE